jgi:hypothetical protein
MTPIDHCVKGDDPIYKLPKENEIMICNVIHPPIDSRNS